MGRAASHITLECALQTHPNITIIGEEVLGYSFLYMCGILLTVMDLSLSAHLTSIRVCGTLILLLLV